MVAALILLVVGALAQRTLAQPLPGGGACGRTVARTFTHARKPAQTLPDPPFEHSVQGHQDGFSQADHLRSPAGGSTGAERAADAAGVLPARAPGATPSPPPSASPRSPSGSAREPTPASAPCIAAARREVGGKKTVDPARGAAAYAALRACMRALQDKGSGREALEVAKAANTLFPAEPQAGFDYGSAIILTGGDPARARALLEEALTRPGRFTRPDPARRAAALDSLGKLALARGEAKAARALLASARGLDPANAEVLFDLAAAEQQDADAAACLAIVKEAFTKAPQLATRDDFLVAAWAYNRAASPAEASTILRRGIAALPNAAGLHLGLGYALALDGKPFEALLEYFYEFENAPAGDVYGKQARELFADGLGRARAVPKFAGAIQDLGAAVASVEDPGAALTHLASLEQNGHQHITLDLLRAEALHASGDSPAAEAALRKILGADPAFLPAYFDLAIILRSSDRDDEARRLVTEAVKRNPAHWQLLGLPAGGDVPARPGSSVK